MADQDWRARKKARTRQNIQNEALRLFAEQGYEATTVEQIATAVGVSHMTFFRHFPTKEDVVVSDEFDPLLEALVRNRPADEPPVTRIQAAVGAGLAQIYETERDALLQRTKLMLHTPALRARLWGNQQTTAGLLDRALADSGAQDPLVRQVVAAACTSALNTAILNWAEQDGVEELPAVIDRAFDALRQGVY